MRKKSDKEKLSLFGPVRNIHIETAQVSYENHTWIDGKHLPSETITFDNNGNSIEEIYYDCGLLDFRAISIYNQNNDMIERTCYNGDGSITNLFYEYNYNNFGEISEWICYK